MEIPFDEIFPNSSAPVHVELSYPMPWASSSPSVTCERGSGWPPCGVFPGGGGSGGDGPGWPQGGGGPGWPQGGGAPSWPQGGGGPGWPPVNSGSGGSERPCGSGSSGGQAVQGGRMAVQHRRQPTPVCYLRGEEGHDNPLCTKNREHASSCVKGNPYFSESILLKRKGDATKEEILLLQDNGKVSVCRDADGKCIEEVEYVSNHTAALHSSHSVPSRLCVTNDVGEYGFQFDDGLDPDYCPDVFGVPSRVCVTNYGGEYVFQFDDGLDPDYCPDVFGVPSRVCVTNYGGEYGFQFDDGLDPDYCPDVFGVPSRVCVTNYGGEYGFDSDDDPDPDYIPDVFDTCSEGNMPEGAELEAEEEEHQDPFPCEASGGDKGGAGYGDHGDPSCYTSPLGARPTYVGVPQLPSHNSVGDIDSNPRIEEEIEYDFSTSHVPVTPAGMFGGRYPSRKRNTHNIQAHFSVASVSGVVQVAIDLWPLEANTIFIEPNNYLEAVNSPESEKWIEAMLEEMGSLKALETWNLVKVSPHQAKRALPVRWVFKIKFAESGEVERFKARLVAKGFKQIYGVDYTEVYAPVSRHATLRYLLSMAVEHNMVVHQLDISTAFLHGKLHEVVYVQQPPGFYEGEPDTVCKLNKALYGLKQAPKAWYDTMSKVLLDDGFVISASDPSLFVEREEGEDDSYVLVYVDDIIVSSKDIDKVSAVKKLLSAHFAVKDLGLVKYFLGMSITQTFDNDGVLQSIKLSNENLTTEIINNFHKEETLSPKQIPMDTSFQLSAHVGELLPADNRYRDLVGGLNYLANTVRPDIAFAASHLSRYAVKPTSHHYRAGISALKYLLGSKDLGLMSERGKSGITGYVDSDYAGEETGEGLLRVMSLSVVQLPFHGEASCITCQLSQQWRQNLFPCAWESKELFGSPNWCQIYGGASAPVKILSDNTGALGNIKGVPISHRTKRIDVKYHGVRQEVEQGSVSPLFVHSAANLADMFTKTLPKGQFLRAGIG
jgi:hypothetical protein